MSRPRDRATRPGFWICLVCLMGGASVAPGAGEGLPPNGTAPVGMLGWGMGGEEPTIAVLGDRGDVWALLHYLTDERCDQAIVAARALGAAGDSRALAFLRHPPPGEVPGDPDQRSRLAAAMAVAADRIEARLGGETDEVGAVDRVGVVASCLEHTSPEVRAAAARTLATLSAVERIDALGRRAETETDATVQQALQEALTALRSAETP